MVSLKTALNHISHVYHILTPADVIPFAAQDPHGGYHAAYEDGFPVGSMWRVEGQFLYALIRGLKPARVLELGTSHGCSATHILQALKDNEHGTLWCVDNGSQVGVVGDMISPYLRGRAEIHQTPLEEAIAIALERRYTYDFIFEDAMHDAQQVEFVWKNADKLLNPGGMIISHDAMHSVAGPAIREGIARAGYADKVQTVLIDPADCGFAVWRKAL